MHYLFMKVHDKEGSKTKKHFNACYFNYTGIVKALALDDKSHVTRMVCN